jgi:putative spermidine/putrescine transport system permease protein
MIRSKSWKNILFLFFLFFIFIGPILILLILAFSSSWRYPGPGPEGFSLRAFQYVFIESPGFFDSLLSSLAYSLVVMVLAAIITILPAKALARNDFPMKGFVEGLLLSPVLLPVMTFSMGIHIILLRWGLTGTFPGVVIILTLYNYPYMLKALISGYEQIPISMEQTARNLGASWFYTLIRVELPMLIPALAAGGPILFLTAFSEYYLVFLIGGGAVPSLSGYLFPFISGSDYSVSSLLVLVFLTVPFLLFLIQDIIIQKLYTNRSLL